MKLGISAAMPEELRCLTKKNPPPGQAFELAEGVLAIHSGMGPEKALAAGRALLERGAEAILSWGCATALDNGMRPGCLFLPQIIFHSDGRESPVDQTWHERLSRTLSSLETVALGSLAETPTILENNEERTVLRNKSGSLVADMESGALALAAMEKKAPFLAIRVIADCVDDPVPEFVTQSIDEWGRVKWLRVLSNALLRPGEWKNLARLNKHFKSSMSTLKAVCAQAGPDFQAFSLDGDSSE